MLAATMTSWAAPTPSKTGHAETPKTSATSNASPLKVTSRSMLPARNGVA